MKRIIVIVSISSLCFGIAGCASTAINEQPMYGGLEKSKELEKADRDFIDWAVKEYGTREKASMDAADRGWQLYYNNDLSTAMKRFNQAWLLDSNNAQAYWGFGNIAAKQAAKNHPEENLDESIKYLQMAHEKAPTNPRIMADLAFSHTIKGYFLKKYHKAGAEDEFSKAQLIFANAAKIIPAEPFVNGQWSILYFYREDYFRAKEKLDTAITAGYKPDPQYVNHLNKELKKLNGAK